MQWISIRPWAAASLLVVTTGAFGLNSHEPIEKPAVIRFPLVDYRGLIAEMVDRIGDGSAEEAITLLNSASGNHLSLAQLDQFQQKFEQLFEQIFAQSEYSGNDFVGCRAITDRLHEAVVVAYHAKGPVVFRFHLIRPDDEWIVFGLHIGNNMDEFFGEFPIQ